MSPRRGWKAATVLNLWELVEEAPDVLAGEPLFAGPGGGVQGVLGLKGWGLVVDLASGWRGVLGKPLGWSWLGFEGLALEW